jgi:hypothetical protein
MKKLSSSSKKPRHMQSGSRVKAEQMAAIKATLERLDQLEPATSNSAGLIALLRSWLRNESGYDERTWPKLKDAFDEERNRVGARRLFDA